MKKETLILLWLVILPLISVASPGQHENSHELFPAAQNHKSGYIDQTGKIVIPFQFDDAGPFSEGRAPIMLRRKWGFIDQTGKIVIKPQFEEAQIFSENRAAVKFEKAGREVWGYIDVSGHVMIQPRYDEVHPFFEQRALVSVLEGEGEDRQAKYGYIDNHGKEITSLKFFSAGDFSEGLANVGINGKWGYIDSMGKIIINPQFNFADQFSEGLAVVEIGSLGSDQHGYIDKTGKMVVPAQFEDARNFSEGLAAVKVKNKWGYIDKNGRFVIQPQYSRAWDFREGLARVIRCNKDCMFQYINKVDQIIIQFPFNDTGADDFKNGLATIVTNDGLCYINKSGTCIWESK